MRILAKDHAMAESSKGLNCMLVLSDSRDIDSIRGQCLNSSVAHAHAVFAKNRGANSLMQAIALSAIEDIRGWCIYANAAIDHAVIARSGGLQENPSSELGMTKPTTPSIRLPRARDMVAHQTVFARVLYCGHSFCKSYD
mmetsp:Transcript_114836/g.371254  ORF Transcript_114836/g.371254 Transcript_114836/m.371254 type:complete len:140 (+) Transcript_114836:508-927(+)